MKKSVFGTIVIVLVLALGGLAYLYWSQRTELTELVEQMTIEKEELQEEYEDLAIQFDGYQQMDIRNDSLQDLLSREQQRVQDMLPYMELYLFRSSSYGCYHDNPHRTFPCPSELCLEELPLDTLPVSHPSCKASDQA